jgi:hypothetical protein
LPIVLGFAPACRPDLARKAGTLEIRAIHVPADADAVRAQLTMGSATYTSDMQRESAMWVITASSPPGTVDIEVSALLNNTALATVKKTETVIEGVATPVVVDFSAPSGTDGGVEPGGYSDNVAFSVLVACMTISGSALHSFTALDTSSYRSFLSAADASLGHAASRISVRSAGVTLTNGHGSVDRFHDLYNGSVSIGLGKEPGYATVATFEADESLDSQATAAVTASADTMLATYQGSLTGSPNGDIAITGDTTRQSNESCGATMVIQLGLTAH